jgi:tetratricopeptide (TPR) repeat protein
MVFVVLLIAITPQPVEGPGANVVEMRRKVSEAVEQGRIDDAIAIAEAGVKSETAAHPEGHLDAARAMYTLAERYVNRERYADAETVGQKGLAIFEKVGGANDLGVAGLLGVIAKARVGLKAYDQAESDARRALAIADKFPSQRLWVSTLRKVVAQAKLGRKELQDAEENARQALAIAEEASGPDSASVLNVLETVSDVFHAQKRHGEEVLTDRRMVSIAEKLYGTDSMKNLPYLKELSTAYYWDGSYREAEPIQRRILKMREKSGSDVQIADEAEFLAAMLLCQRKPFEADEVARRALALREKAEGTESLGLARVLSYLVMSASERNDPLAEEGFSLRIVAILEKAHGQKAAGSIDANLVEAYRNLESVHEARGRLDQARMTAEKAISLGERAIPVIEKSDGPESPKIRSILNSLEPMYLVTNQPGKASEARKRLEKMEPKSAPGGSTVGKEEGLR